MHIALIYSKGEELSDQTREQNLRGASIVRNTVHDVEEALLENGHTTTLVQASSQLLSQLEEIEPPDLLFNLSTGLLDKRSQANMVGLLEMTGFPILGSGLISHVVGLHKEITKSLLTAHGIRTARFQLIGDEEEAIRGDFKYPLIVKPEHEGSGVGVTESSFVKTPAQLKRAITEKVAVHDQVLLVEEFLPGREFTVGVIGNKTLEILPIKETIFPEDGVQILTDAMKIEEGSLSEIPARLPDDLEEEILEMTEKTYRLLRCRDYARIDFRLDDAGKPHVIELNTAPGLKDNYSFFPKIAEAAGYSYPSLINRLVEVALEPRGLQ